MESVSLSRVADEQLEIARSSHSGRAAHTVHGGHDHQLKQTLIALAADHGLGDHESPGQSTLQVLRGQVRISAGDDVWTGAAGDYVVLPRERHGLHAEEDSVVLLTVLADSRPAQ